MTTRTAQELAALAEAGRHLDERASTVELYTVELLNLAVATHSQDTNPPDRAALVEATRKICTDVHRHLTHSSPEQLSHLIAIAELTGMQRAQDDPSLARKKRQRRRRLKTPQQICAAIAEVNGDLELEQITPAAARARLYALQTLLVAMKMHPADPHGEILPAQTIRELQAAQEHDE